MTDDPKAFAQKHGITTAAARQRLAGTEVAGKLVEGVTDSIAEAKKQRPNRQAATENIERATGE